MSHEAKNKQHAYACESLGLCDHCGELFIYIYMDGNSKIINAAI